MVILDFFHASPTGFLITILILGLIVGSFLNVVIYRLPVMMERGWMAQCRELMAAQSTEGATADPSNTPQAERFDLVLPSSRCPHCGHAIRALENVPVLSYLFLRGKCSACGASISPRYPVVEAITGVLSVVVAWKFGVTWAAVGALLVTWSLIALTMIDFDHQLLPDSITLPFLWLGLIFNLFATYTDLQSAVIGAVAGYMSLWLIYQLFKLITGKEGMGFGDFKLFAMLGAWLGWQALPLIILLSSFVGAVVGIGLIAFRGRDRSIPIPFGPYLAAAGWIAFIWGEQISAMYLRAIGL